MSFSDLIRGYSKGFYNIFSSPNKTFVHIVSTTRSGTTLLKALLAEAPDVSNIREYDVFRVRMKGPLRRYITLAGLSPKRIIVLKKPPLFDFNHYFADAYPYIPFKEDRIILLVRNIPDTVMSMKKMIVDAHFPKAYHYLTYKDLIDHWCDVYESIIKNIKGLENSRIYILRYEDLVKDPNRITRELYSFVGSSKKEGVNKYSNPTDREWRWGYDDGGEVIKTLKVSLNKKKVNRELMSVLKKSKRAKKLYDKFGYSFPNGKIKEVSRTEILKRISE